MGTIMKVIGVIILIVILMFGLEMAGLQWTKFFAPKRENVKREVFENTKSFTRGMAKELAKHYKEYNNAESEEDKQIIRSVIQSDFADFDIDKLNSAELRKFLKNIRGY